MNTTLYIIKPEAMRHREAIRRIIQAKGLSIGSTKRIVFPTRALDKLYPDFSDPLRLATYRFMGSRMETGIITGEDAVISLLNIAGTETNPALCAPGTIRNVFGMQEPLFFGTVLYYANAVHRPKNDLEATEHIAIFKEL